MLKITNKTTQPIPLFDGTILFSYESILLDEDRMTEQLKKFEKLGFIKIGKPRGL